MSIGTSPFSELGWIRRAPLPSTLVNSVGVGEIIGALPRERLDFRVVAALGQLQEEAAIAAVEEMGRTDLSRLRNPSDYNK